MKIEVKMKLIKVDRTEYFAKWFRKLKDFRTKAIIEVHIDRMEEGNFGTFESIGDGVYEKKIDYDPGYRLYCEKKNDKWIILLCGGDKSTQKADIIKAKHLKEIL